MRPKDLKTRIFLDSGDPKETKEVLDKLGFLDGQTTNPSLMAKNPEAQEKLVGGEKFTRNEVYEFYQRIIDDIYEVIPEGSLSVEVYADKSTSVDEMLEQARKMNKWAPHAHIKLPITKAGLEAGEILTKEKVHLNFTLNFSQEQAAAVHAATKGAKKEQIYISPFIGRLDDVGRNGVDLVANILEMYRKAESHVNVLAASIRSIEHIIAVVSSNVDIITAQGKTLKEWASSNFSMLSEAEISDLDPIDYQEHDLEKDWQDFNISHDLTDAGLQKFADDWNALIE